MIEPDKRKAVFRCTTKGCLCGRSAAGCESAATRCGSSSGKQGRCRTAAAQDKQASIRELLRRLYQECEGRMQRDAREVGRGGRGRGDLFHAHADGAGVGHWATRRNTRCQRVPDEPGAEMQHDTSRYHVELAGDLSGSSPACIYLRYSKRRYLKFYRAFNRFQMKCFFHEALMFWGYAAPPVHHRQHQPGAAAGHRANSGDRPGDGGLRQAVWLRVPLPRVRHTNRKAGEERSFWTVETNFLPGRTFATWRTSIGRPSSGPPTRMDHTPQGKAGLIPAKAFEHERSFLIALPDHLPAPYRVHRAAAPINMATSPLTPITTGCPANGAKRLRCSNTATS